MLKKRIIPCLDVQDGRTVKGVNFFDLCDAGDPVELGKRYAEEGADELIFLDITATHEERNTAIDLAERVSREISIPFTIGGGVRSAEDFYAILRAGADKVSVNSAAVKNPNLISKCSEAFGAQAVVVAIDAKKQGKEWEVFVSGGRRGTGKNVLDWARQAEEFGAGEILLTSMDRDGTKEGFDIDLLNAVCEQVKIPVIASGGVGSTEHFLEVFLKTPATGALAASVFHFGDIAIPNLKKMLSEEGIPIRL
ncbi:imidazole glycerol phosphate synthase subunit HisF [Candidatus Peregrinibacteria bacterium]|nr:MAG: imidazole glycerol phosphate synthase subunit HisF [Candidatus Peregrinibacteria bacterium]